MARMAMSMMILLTLSSGLALAGGTLPWVQFEDQTATRIDTSQDPNSGPSVIVSNPDEKDYAWGDLDNDGDIDLVAVYKQLGTTTGKRRNVLLMNENGVLVDRTTQFATASAVTLASGSPSQGFLDLTNDRDVAVVDLTGDGWPEVVTATTLSGGSGGTIGDKAISHPRVYLNLADDPPGSGIWQGLIFDDTDRVPTMPAEPRFNAVAAGDIDGDGDTDLYFGDSQQGGFRPTDLDNRLWINDGAGQFTDESALRMTSDQLDVSFCPAVAIVDLNGDDALDVVINDTLNAPTSVSIIHNDTTNEGFFQAMPREDIYTLSPYHVWVGELNNDDMLDLIITDDALDRYMLNAGNGEDGLADFGPALVLIGSEPHHFGGNSLAADLNHDAFQDALVASVNVDLPSCNLPAKIFRNLGDTPDVTLEEQGQLGIAASHLLGVHDFAVFDINGDEWLDLVIGRCSGTSVYINQAIVPCAALGDMNADGAVDGRDIPNFTECFLTQAPSCNCADLNADQAIDDFDVQRFVFELLIAE